MGYGDFIYLCETSNDTIVAIQILLLILDSRHMLLIRYCDMPINAFTTGWSESNNFRYLTFFMTLL